MKPQSDEITQHPRERANIVSVLLFCWTYSTFKKGMRKDLEAEDLFGPLKSHQSHMLGERLEEEWSKEIDRKNPLLYRALFRAFGHEIIIRGVELLFVDFLGLLQPYLIARLISQYLKGGVTTTEQKKSAYILLSIIVVINFTRVIITNAYELSMKHLGMKIRIACSSLIYRKSLKLSKSTFTGSTIGHMVNLLSNDVARFDRVMLNLHRFWLTPIEVVVMVLFFYYNYGFKTIVGCLFFIIACVPFQILIGFKCSMFRYKMALRTDERVRWMSILVNRMKVIKMYTLEQMYTNLITSIRKAEMQCALHRFYLRCALYAFTMISKRFCNFIVIATNVLTGNVPSPLYCIILGGFHTVFVRIVMQFTVFGVPQVVETTISVKRIKMFLMLQETTALRRDGINVSKSPVRIRFQNATAKWAKSAGLENTLTDINLVIRDKCLIAIIGEVGSGKTSLLKVVMRELPLLKGSCVVNGRLSYAGQEPWLLHASIKDNILLGQPMDRRRYREVLMACSLQNDLARFEYGDRTLAGGANLNIGEKVKIALARAFYRDADIYIFDYPFTAIDMNTSTDIFARGFLKLLHGKCILLVTQRVQFLSKVDKIVLMKKGRIEMFRTYLQMQRTVYDVGKILVVIKEAEDDPDKDEIVLEKAKDERQPQKRFEPQDKEDSKGTAKEFKKGGKVTKAIYATYIRCGASWIWVFLIFMTFILAQGFATGSDYFVPYWLSWEKKRVYEVPYSKVHFSLYGAMIAMVIILTVTRNILFYRFCIRASINLHDKVFCKIVNGKMSFFATNPTGRILNRFSQDMGAVDEMLPNIMMENLQTSLDILGVCLVVSIVTSWAVVPTVLLLLLLYCFRGMYLRTSRNLKRLEAISSVLDTFFLLKILLTGFVLDRSPVMSHLNSTIHGLVTVRAFEVQDTMVRRFDDRQDLHSSAFYLLLACNQAFSLWVDLLAVVYISVVLFSYIYMGTEHYGSKLVNHLVTMSGILKTGMILWAETENHMTSVERMIEYMEVEQEVDPKYGEIPKEWPERGTIEFRNVYMRYSNEKPHVLKDITFKIEQHEKVAIVGKTGHGKSSLIFCLFMIADIEGDIFVDDVNINQVPLQTLRSKITIVPQEPVLFAGTVRENVDPLGIYEDIQIWNVLDTVQLKDVVSELEFGLDTGVAEGGVNFTTGQRHLFCLAKAILYKSKILILDDITANIDSYTESVIDETIKKNFKDCTVLNIVHNITDVFNYDKIIFIENGQIVECDHPITLLNNKGPFYRMFKGANKSHNASSEANYVKLGYRFRF